ncbi:hypothetical protein K438DRAFT_1991634 [Mycena galopus ATCC 62051]|nr:hypothetical protein K438DRAFT_1991634 [Mycena galopus ATCC 62051]
MVLPVQSQQGQLLEVLEGRPRTASAGDNFGAGDLHWSMVVAAGSLGVRGLVGAMWISLLGRLTGTWLPTLGSLLAHHQFPPRSVGCYSQGTFRHVSIELKDLQALAIVPTVTSLTHLAIRGGYTQFQFHQASLVSPAGGVCLDGPGGNQSLAFSHFLVPSARMEFGRDLVKAATRILDKVSLFWRCIGIIDMPPYAPQFSLADFDDQDSMAVLQRCRRRIAELEAQVEKEKATKKTPGISE